MIKIAAGFLLFLVAAAASAHQDRIFRIGEDGTLGAVPATYGPVKVHINRAKGNPGTLTRVAISSPHFNVVLNQCILGKLRDVTKVEASGSWYHTRVNLPAYVSLTFYSGKYDLRSYSNSYYSVTFSLLDGHILSGQRAWDPLVGSWRAQIIDPADKCSHWQHLAMWPNNSVKPTPLRSGA
ncbi:hypothetical protein FHY18_000482 [Xanthomonas arboricola]|uniref:hypothetical protein n=1 Tax=Xanthomonas sp. 3793 TaxID=3035312 RepID=UPI002168F7DC|nr:hypothetical protein [Xanthomonas sp. 3793]MCS3744952.1 hypothetical protein [Xanthomonas sp. 3793]